MEDVNFYVKNELGYKMVALKKQSLNFGSQLKDGRSHLPRGISRGSADACWDCGFEFRRGHGYLSVVSVVCCQVEVSASGWSLVQRSPTEFDVSECDREASILRRPWSAMGCCAIGGGGGTSGLVACMENWNIYMIYMNSNIVRSQTKSYGIAQRTCILVVLLGSLSKRC